MIALNIRILAGCGLFAGSHLFIGKAMLMRSFIIGLMLVYTGAAGLTPAHAQTQTDIDVTQCADGSERLPFDALSAGGARLDVSDSQISYAPGADQPGLAITLTDEGAKALAEVSAASIGRVLVIMIGEERVIAPMVREPVRGGRLFLQGDFTRAELDDFRERITPKCAE